MYIHITNTNTHSIRPESCNPADHKSTTSQVARFY